MYVSTKQSADMGCIHCKTKDDPPTSDTNIYRALHNFDTVSKNDVPFKKGDRIEVDLFSQTGDWWTATHLTSGRKGYIPSNYVCKDDNNPENQDWWFEVDRNEAERILLLANNKPGTFLIRGASDNNSSVLSVREIVRETGNPCVKHYRICNTDDGEVYITPKRTFRNLIDLVKHYKAAVDGLSCQLTDPCPRLRPVMHFDQLEISRESIKLLDHLGAGCFGEVYKGKLYNRVEVAVKTLKPGSMPPEAFLTEAKLMHKLRHGKLVQLMAVHTATQPIWIVTELCANGALLDYLRGDRERTIKFPTMIGMAAQIAEGMAYLEEKNFVHRDLRAANILVGEHSDVKVADFGLARFLQQNDIYNASEGTRFPVKWTAPEAALEGKFSIKSDVWSYGVLLYEIITKGRTPYPDMRNSEVIVQIVAPRFYRMPKPHGTEVECPDSYYEAMLNCWKDRAEERPTFEYWHHFFDDYLHCNTFS